MEARTDDLANISELGVNSRLKRAVIGVGITLVAMILLVTLHAPRFAIALLFIPFFVTINLAFQALFKTCSFMAVQGMRDMGDGHEKLASCTESAALRARGRKIFLVSALAAAAATAIAVLASMP